MAAAAAKRRRCATEEVPAPAARVVTCLFGADEAAPAAAQAGPSAASGAPSPVKADPRVAALYRLPVEGNVIAPVREKNDRSSGSGDAVADFVGFQSPFKVVNLADAGGIWQKQPKLVKQLGEDPRGKRRALHELKTRAGGVQSAVAPAGLKNLGATCYLNSLLQYLFFNADFRACLLRAATNSGVVTALQKVFALLTAGREVIVDPVEFVQAAGVEAGEQEDATEFSALLLDWLERELGKGVPSSAATAAPALVDAAAAGSTAVDVADSGKANAAASTHDVAAETTVADVPDAATAEQAARATSEADEAVSNGKFIPALFQGEVAQLLTCLKNPTHCFERRENFYELRVNLKPGKPTPPSAAASRSTTAAGKRTPAAPVATVVPPSDREASAAVTGVAQAGADSISTKKLGKKKESSTGAFRLEDLLAESAFPDEMMTGDNRYHCPKCDCKVDARKSLRLARPPPYLHVTVGRYHYDLQKGVRKKLNSPISFPQRLKLRLCRSSAELMPPTQPSSSSPGSLPVMYECIGYLEHVSDSAHSGHYTATLYQEEEDAPDASGAPKRLRRSESGADAAAGGPRQGIWWSLDDDVVTPVSWRMLGGDSASAGASFPNPQRIESSSAYLLLYRRSDHKPGDLVGRRQEGRGVHELPPKLAEFMETTNGSLDSDQREFDVNSAAVNRYLAERRPVIDTFVTALRDATRTGQPNTGLASGYSVVPSAWFDAYLHGADVPMETMIAGDTELRAVTYGPSLLRGADDKLALDPFAVLCGEVKLVPTAALEARGLRGLDSSIFLDASDALGADTCKRVCDVACAFWEEWAQIGRILQDRTMKPPSTPSDESSNDAVWISMLVQKAWQKAGADESGRAAKVAAMNALFAEAHETRWRTRPTEEPTTPVDEEACETAGTASTPAKRETITDITDGLCCAHGLVCNTKAAVLVKKLDVERLLELSAAKAEAYRRLWPELVHEVAPKLRASCVDEMGRLLGSDEVCAVCNAASGGEVGPSSAAGGGKARRMQIRRRYPSGVVRKPGKGFVNLPKDGSTPTGAVLRALVLEQLGFVVAKLHVQNKQGSEVELEDKAPLGSDADAIIVERDESTPPHREAAAFQGSVFRGS